MLLVRNTYLIAYELDFIAKIWGRLAVEHVVGG